MARDYGEGGWVGIGTPQANPTVEMEMRRLLAPDVEPLTTRLTSQAASADGRLVDYIEGLPTYLKAFDQLPLEAFGFACTGSSYLVGQEKEAAIAEAAAAKFGYPVLMAGQAVTAALRALGGRRIAMIAPYPQHLIDAGAAYWEAAGFSVVARCRIDIGTTDTRAIYGLGGDAALAAARTFDPQDADVVLLSGTGMPTLRAIPEVAAMFDRPAVSSNSCLAWALMTALGRKLEPTDIVQ